MQSKKQNILFFIYWANFITSTYRFSYLSIFFVQNCFQTSYMIFVMTTDDMLDNALKSYLRYIGVYMKITIQTIQITVLNKTRVSKLGVQGAERGWLSYHDYKWTLLSSQSRSLKICSERDTRRHVGLLVINVAIKDRSLYNYTIFIWLIFSTRI